jgi:hypothetical protein
MSTPQFTGVRWDTRCRDCTGAQLREYAVKGCFANRHSIAKLPILSLYYTPYSFERGSVYPFEDVCHRCGRLEYFHVGGRCLLTLVRFRSYGQARRNATS